VERARGRWRAVVVGARNPILPDPPAASITRHHRVHHRDTCGGLTGPCACVLGIFICSAARFRRRLVAPLWVCGGYNPGVRSLLRYVLLMWPAGPGGGGGWAGAGGAQPCAVEHQRGGGGGAGEQVETPPLTKARAADGAGACHRVGHVERVLHRGSVPRHPPHLPGGGLVCFGFANETHRGGIVWDATPLMHDAQPRRHTGGRAKLRSSNDPDRRKNRSSSFAALDQNRLRKSELSGRIPFLRPRRRTAPEWRCASSARDS